MNEKTDFDFWVVACGAQDCYMYQLERNGDCLLFVSRPQDKDKNGNFKYSPLYWVFNGGKRLMTDSNYLAAYKAWERAAGLARDDLEGLARYEAMR